MNSTVMEEVRVVKDLEEWVDRWYTNILDYINLSFSAHFD